MNRDELVKLGGKLDGVELVEYPDPWPVKGTRAEKRAERVVALWFAARRAGRARVRRRVHLLAGAVQGRRTSDGHFMYALYTPVLGVTLGVAILGVGIGVLIYTSKFIPHEIAVQDRHDGGSPSWTRPRSSRSWPTRATSSTIARRSMIKRIAGVRRRRARPRARRARRSAA